MAGTFDEAPPFLLVRGGTRVHWERSPLPYLVVRHVL